MVKNVKILLFALLITFLIFISIYFSNILLNKKREEVILERMDTVIENYEDMQTLSVMSDVFGEEVTCLSMNAQILSMNKELWDTGRKIDQYREVTEQFMNDPFYLEQKRRFNRNQVLYFSMLKRMNDWCEVNQSVILYFYKKKEECPDCDAQAFVLTDIKNDLNQEIAIFSFDSDLALAPVTILAQYYNVTTYPCIIVDEIPYCGLYDKKMMMEIFCASKNLSTCSQYPSEDSRYSE